MPRIRSLKPEALQHRKVGALSDRAFRLWVGAITQADDEGRLVADLEQLRVLVFGFHPKVTSREVASARDEIRATGLIRVYTVGDTEYAELPSWKDHQRVDHPTTSKLPPYTEPANAREDSRILAKTLVGSDLDLTGKERIGRDHLGATAPSTGSLPADAEGFGLFWTAYPRKTAKAAALKAWNVLWPDAELQAKILSAVEAQRTWPSWTKDSGQFIPHPATWIRGRRWEDQGPLPTDTGHLTPSRARLNERWAGRGGGEVSL